MGETKHITRKLIYDIYHKFHVKGAVKRRPVPHVSLFGPFRCKSIRVVLQGIKEIGADYSKLDYDVDGFDYFDSKKKFLFITTSTKKNVIYLKIKPSDDLTEFRYKLAKKLLKITNTANFENDSKSKFHFHATLAMKDIDRKFDGLWDYLKKYDIRIMGVCYRITLIKDGKIMYEYELSTKKLLNRRQALGPRFRRSGGVYSLNECDHQ